MESAEEIDRRIRELAAEIRRLDSGARAGLDQTRGRARDILAFVQELDRDGSPFIHEDDCEALFLLLSDLLESAIILLALEGPFLRSARWNRIVGGARALSAELARIQSERLGRDDWFEPE